MMEIGAAGSVRTTVTFNTSVGIRDAHNVGSSNQVKFWVVPTDEPFLVSVIVSPAAETAKVIAPSLPPPQLIFVVPTESDRSD